MKVSSISMASSSSSVLKSEIGSSVSEPSTCNEGEPVERKTPEAAACVSVGELREAEGLWPRELRAMSM